MAPRSVQKWVGRDSDCGLSYSHGLRDTGPTKRWNPGQSSHQGRSNRHPASRKHVGTNSPPGQRSMGSGKGTLRGLLTCQLVSGSPETTIRKIVRRGRGALGRSVGAGKFSLRLGPLANCTVKRSPLKSLPSGSVNILEPSNLGYPIEHTKRCPPY